MACGGPAKAPIMNTLLYKSARFCLRMTPQAVEPGAIGLIVDVEQSPRPAPGLRVRIRVGDYVSPWIPPWRSRDLG